MFSVACFFTVHEHCQREYIGQHLLCHTPLAELDYEDIFKSLPKDKQKEIMSKREYFAEKAGIGVQ